MVLKFQGNHLGRGNELPGIGRIIGPQFLPDLRVRLYGGYGLAGERDGQCPALHRVAVINVGNVSFSMVYYWFSDKV